MPSKKKDATNLRFPELVVRVCDQAASVLEFWRDRSRHPAWPGLMQQLGGEVDGEANATARYVDAKVRSETEHAAARSWLASEAAELDRLRKDLEKAFAAKRWELAGLLDEPDLVYAGYSGASVCEALLLVASQVAKVVGEGPDPFLAINSAMDAKPLAGFDWARLRANLEREAGALLRAQRNRQGGGRRGSNEELDEIACAYIREIYQELLSGELPLTVTQVADAVTKELAARGRPMDPKSVRTGLYRTSKFREQWDLVEASRATSKDEAKRRNSGALEEDQFQAGD